MRTYLECIPCFFRQALEAARIVGADDDKRREIMNRIAAEVPRISLLSTPPEMGKIIYSIVSDVVGDGDPYLELKKRSTKLCMDIYDELKARLDNSDDRLLMAVQLAIAGNIIDYGAKMGLDVKREVERILSSEHQAISSERSELFAFEEFAATLKDSRTVLYLGDNVGETVFDRVLIEEILSLYPDKDITYAVKASPVINDALVEDARECGIDSLANVISSGSDLPGTLLDRCSDDFCRLFREADLIISKGQGNFETLSETEGPVFFLFIAKCLVVAHDVGCSVGDVMLMKGCVLKMDSNKS